MEKTRSGLRRRSQRLLNNDTGATPTATLPVQNPRARASIPSDKRRKAPPSTGTRARPKRPNDQKTLTQIDFVTRVNPTPDPDLDLDYIEDNAPSPPRRSRNKGKPKKARIDRNQNNTLTQMDYVARRLWDDNEDGSDQEIVGNDMAHVSGTDDDDDDDLERAGSAPRWKAVQDESSLESGHTPSPERRAKRRRLDNRVNTPPASFESRKTHAEKYRTGPGKENESIKADTSLSQPNAGTNPVSAVQVTPRKQRKWEIPSSQSPDSPGFIMVRDSPRSPFRVRPLNSPLASASCKMGQAPSSAKVAACNLSHTKQQSSGAIAQSPITVGSQCTPRTLVTDNETPETSPMPTILNEARKGSCYPPQSPLGMKTKSQERPCASEDVYGPKYADEPDAAEGRVIYETDAESEDGFHDTRSYLSGQELDVPPGDLNDIHGEADPRNTPRTPSNPNLNSHPNPEEAEAGPGNSTAMSDISILYHRRPQDYPLDPTASELSDIDPDRLAELFPDNEQETIGPTLPAYSNSELARPPRPPTLNLPDISTEFVPESSQRPVQEESHDIPCSSPPEVILVESSQPNGQTTQGERRDSHHSTAPKDIFTASQLLPDSLMESIPGPPPEWMFSEDSIHE